MRARPPPLLRSRASREPTGPCACSASPCLPVHKIHCAERLFKALLNSLMSIDHELTGQSTLTAAVEDYVKAVYMLEGSGEAASTNALAARLDVTPAAVSGMLRKLAGLGLVQHERYHGVRLTERGRLVALEVIRHHRL